MSDSCGTCSYWLRQNGEQGICRRFPPTPILIMAGESLALPGGMKQMNVQIQSYYPPMLANGWCGEFRPMAENMQ